MKTDAFLRPITAAVILFGLISGARAAGDIVVRPGGNFKPVTVAVTSLVGDDGQIKLSDIITNDFGRSVFLEPILSTNFPEQIGNPDVRPNLDAWKTVNAQFVVTGRVSHSDSAHLTAQFRLWDVAKGQQVAGQQYVTDATNTRRVAHLIADAVFSQITGETGFFDSHVVFVDETGPAQKRRKRLA